MEILKDKRIAVYLTGGIAVYKMANLVRQLIKKGAQVRVAMTSAATEFITPLTFQVLTQKEVLIDNFSEDHPEHVAHIELADWSDLALVSPATANTINKMAHGVADNLVTSALLATDCPVFIVPAMNEKMFYHFSTQKSIKVLKEHDYYVMDPDIGFLAEGYEGKGRFPNEERIVEELEQWSLKYEEDLPLSGQKIIITAGGTQEKIDPVRYLTNRSSGRMGHALAQSAFNLGAEVLLITASSLPVHRGIQTIRVSSAEEMANAIFQSFSKADGLIMAAAVSDYRPVKTANQKIKKQDNDNHMTIELTENPDILAEIGQKKTDDQWTVGFAAETNHLEAYAQKKLKTKNADFIVANDVSIDGQGFDTSQNAGIIYKKNGSQMIIPLQSKSAMADVILKEIISDLIVN